MTGWLLLIQHTGRELLYFLYSILRYKLDKHEAAEATMILVGVLLAFTSDTLHIYSSIPDLF